jgi:hypothetical protein|tara:strand:+ start:489 stop:710 length:222 start_codon:yes stop_codon:yes gene_type:complete
MPLRFIKSLNPYQPFDGEVIVNDEEEEGGEYLFDPEAGRASDDPFAHLKVVESPDDSADSNESVSKYVGGEEE